jgi:hypothetical protein
MKEQKKELSQQIETALSLILNPDGNKKINKTIENSAKKLSKDIIEIKEKAQKKKEKEAKKAEIQAKKELKKAQKVKS